MEKSVFTAEYRILLAMLRAERKRKKITQVMVAERIHQTQTFYSECERGERRVDVVELMHICRAIEVDFLDFMHQLHDAIQQSAAI